jgi:hypothetical protein
MSAYLDQKYINLVSTSLEMFKWKKINLANCRCPICGDSENNKKKARGYFFVSNNTYFYKCHNCGASHNVYKFLELVSPALFKEYCLEQFKEKNQNTKFVVETVSQEVKTPNIKLSYDKLENLSANHKAIEFVIKRKIPKQHWNKIGYVEHFANFAKEINSSYDLIDDERIIIPIYNEHNQIIGAQGRAFGKTKPKYVTLKCDQTIKLIYGMNTVNKSKPIFVVEGPLDSLFLPNAIACLGSGNFLEIREKFPTQDLIFVLDNEPRNKEVVNVYNTLIENGEKICIFPNHIKEKDINDMVLNNLSPCDIIRDNTYQKAAATIAFNSWRKCK